MGRRRKKTRTHKEEEETGEKPPRSFVVSSGTVVKSVQRLVRDVRRLLEPNTAVRLRERRSNVIKDYVAMAGPLGVTHMLVFSQTETGVNLRLGRLPRGPTLQFRVLGYSHIADVVNSQARPRSAGGEYMTPPLLVLNNFTSQSKHFLLISTMLQNLFPSINVETLRLSEARRVVLFNYNAESDTIDLRHYLITVTPVGLSRNIKRIVQAKIPDLHNLTDISELLEFEGAGSESEMDEPDNQVTLAQNYVGRNNRSKEQRSVRLVEIGPRMTLQLLKVQRGFCEGDVLYHKYIQKSTAEVKAIMAERERKSREKAMRRAQQEANVKRKQEARQKALEEQRRRLREKYGSKAADGDQQPGSDDDEQDDEAEGERKRKTRRAPQPAADDEDDDREYFRQEVGEEPDEEFGSFARPTKRKRGETDEYTDKASKSKRAAASDADEDDGGDGARPFAKVVRTPKQAGRAFKVRAKKAARK